MKSSLIAMCAALGVSISLGEPMIVAHRGASADAPENTLSAFHEAWKQGADAIEGDFRLTKDGHIVTMHDQSTKRTTGKDFVISETNWAALQELDAGSWKGEQWQGEKIPLLSEVLAGMPEGKGIFIEVKCGPEIVPKLLKVLSKSKTPLEQVTVIAFDKEVVRAVKKQQPKLKANWLCSFKKSGSGNYSPDLDSVMQTLKEVGADGLGAQAVEALAEDLGTRLKREHLGFHVWTVDSAEVGKHFVASGAQSVTTNTPKKMRSFMADHQQPSPPEE